MIRIPVCRHGKNQAGIVARLLATRQPVRAERLALQQTSVRQPVRNVNSATDASRDVDPTARGITADRYALLAGVRAACFDVLALQRRVDVPEQMVKLSENSVAQIKLLLEARYVARLDLVQLEVELERLRVDPEVAELELPGDYKRPAAKVGNNRLAIVGIDESSGRPLPNRDADHTLRYVLTTYPKLQVAMWEIARARFIMRQAKVEAVPNGSLDTGYVRQKQHQTNEFFVRARLSIPLWSRKQGNIRSTVAHLCDANRAVGRIENNLTDRVAIKMRDCSPVRCRVDRFCTAIRPRAKETCELSREAYQGGQFEYLRVLEAQHAEAQANQVYTRALGDAWKAAATVSGLALEDQWPQTKLNVPPAPVPSSQR
jgi:cobalt-zinc-cadmium efflux system outer membrane protein